MWLLVDELYVSKVDFYDILFRILNEGKELKLIYKFKDINVFWLLDVVFI